MSAGKIEFDLSEDGQSFRPLSREAHGILEQELKNARELMDKLLPKLGDAEGAPAGIMGLMFLLAAMDALEQSELDPPAWIALFVMTQHFFVTGNLCDCAKCMEQPRGEPS